MMSKPCLPAANPDNPMKIKLSEDRKQAVLKRLAKFYSDEFDEELSSFRAERMLAFFIRTLGPPLYNQAVNDARAFMQSKLDDLDVEFYEPEEPL
jgi:uncharacterized protein (DUF2164 family)